MTARIIWIFRNDEMPPALSRSTACVAHAARPNALQVDGRAAPFLPPRASLRGNSASPSGEAPLFDATAEQWIVPPSGMTPDAGAAADLRHTQAAHTRSSAIPLKADERPLHPIVECITVALGLTVFGLIAGVLLVLA